MKRLIVVLLVMGVIMTAFAEEGTSGRMYVTSTPTKAAETEVVLDLNQNAGIVWFSAGDNQNVSTYYLTLPNINGLNQSTEGNGNWVARGTDLKLNWNIVSCSGVQIDLEIDGVLKGENDSDNTIGWMLTFDKTAYSGNTGTPEEENIEIYAGYPGKTGNNLTETAITKDNSIYGSSGYLLIDEIITENTYGKNVDVYKATLTAKISTI